MNNDPSHKERHVDSSKLAQEWNKERAMFVRIPWSLVSALIIPFVLAIGYSFMIKDRQVALSDDVQSISTQADILSDRMHRLDNRVTRLETVHEQKSHINRMSR